MPVQLSGRLTCLRLRPAALAQPKVLVERVGCCLGYPGLVNVHLPGFDNGDIAPVREDVGDDSLVCVCNDLSRVSAFHVLGWDKLT